MFSLFEVFDDCVAFFHFFGADDDGVWNVFLIGIFELLVEFALFVEEFAADAFCAEGLHPCECGLAFGLAEVEEQGLGANVDGFGEEVEFFHDVVDAVYAEADAYAGNVGYVEEAGEVVVATAAPNAAYFDGGRCFYFEDESGIVIESACQCEIDHDVDVFAVVDQEGYFFYSFAPGFVGADEVDDLLQFFFVGAVYLQVLLDNGYLLLAEATLGEFVFYFFETDFIQLIDGDGDVDHFIGTAAYFCKCRQDLTAVDAQFVAVESEAGECAVVDAGQFYFID